MRAEKKLNTPEYYRKIYVFVKLQLFFKFVMYRAKGGYILIEKEKIAENAVDSKTVQTIQFQTGIMPQ